ncbi:hypothetical protein L1274_001562 [Duganella sp. HSC-15S17]|uniref:Uncharacterized protein n=1 Tax=Duganella violaceipulchra TaxID=2849652 RepID=A0ABT1GFW8_9BURK|nr:hypothetical protein [Duganella violaceicalia]
MFNVSPYFTPEEIRRICENMSVSIDDNPHLSERSKRIIKSVHFSREDIEKTIAKMAAERKTR